VCGQVGTKVDVHCLECMKHSGNEEDNDEDDGCDFVGCIEPFAAW
jgi:hypothetical protein